MIWYCASTAKVAKKNAIKKTDSFINLAQYLFNIPILLGESMKIKKIQ